MCVWKREKRSLWNALKGNVIKVGLTFNVGHGIHFFANKIKLCFVHECVLDNSPH